MYTYPTLDYLTRMPLDDLMSLARLNRAEAAKYFGRSIRTIDRWRRSPPRQVVKHLTCLAGYLESHDTAWRGWRVHGNALVTDSGVIVQPGEIRALPWLHSIAARECRHFREKLKGTNIIGLPVPTRQRF